MSVPTELKKRIATAIVCCLFLACDRFAAKVAAQDNGWKPVFPQPVMLLAFDYSEDGSHFVVGGNFGFWVYRTDFEHDTLIRRESHLSFVRKVAFSPASKKQFVTWSDDNLLRLWEMDQPSPAWAVAVEKGYAFDIGFFPDGKSLFLCGYEVQSNEDEQFYTGHVTVFDSKTGAVQKEFRFDDQTVSSCAVSHDGNLLAVAKSSAKPGDTDSSVVVYTRSDWRHLYTAAILDGFPSSVAFLNEANDLLITGGKFFGEDASPQRNGKIWVTRLRDKDGGSKLLYQGGEESYREGDTSPNGQGVAIGTTEGHDILDARGDRIGWQMTTIVERRSAATGERIWSVDGKVGEPYGVTFSPNGSRVAFCSGDTIYFVSAEDGSQEREIVPPR